MAKKKCLICGKPGFMFYPYCKKHLDMKNEGKLEQDVNNSNKKQTPQEDHKKHHHKNHCLICGEETEENFLFCKTHYKEYKNKTILIKFSDCIETEFVGVIDKYESGLVYVCKDGHRVRSKSEVQIDNYLYDHDIKHAYEKAYPINDNKDSDLHPDFYLPELNLYIEHWGYTNKANYEKEKKYKTDIYNKNKTTVIGTVEEDMHDIETSLTRKLKFFKKGQVN